MLKKIKPEMIKLMLFVVVLFYATNPIANDIGLLLEMEIQEIQLVITWDLEWLDKATI